jgi:MFS family permease
MRFILPLIVIAQFFCTSVWFASNSIIGDIAGELSLTTDFLAHLTSAIQFGFIIGTLVFAIFTISDRFSPSMVFFISAIFAAVFNLLIALPGIDANMLLFFRFVTGFFLAGIYPVGMKIASDYFREGLGKSLGFLVGALVLGKAFPHLLNSITEGYPWRYVVYATSALSCIGGLLIFSFVPNGPYRKWSTHLNFTAFLDGFKIPAFRSVAFGYFGHMWELYTFWVFVPVMLFAYNNRYPDAGLNVSFFSFLIIASGTVSCIVSGLLSQKWGAKKMATIALSLSCVCCLVSPFFLMVESSFLLIAFLVFWGIVVIADSPLFSTLIAHNAPSASRGTSLTIVNCIGFAITIISIQCMNAVSEKINLQYAFMFLAIGPVLGLMALIESTGKQQPNPSG